MASPALAAVASRRSRFLFPARVSTPIGALEDIVKGVVCALLCVEASEKSVTKFSSFSAVARELATWPSHLQSIEAPHRVAHERVHAHPDLLASQYVTRFPPKEHILCHASRWPP